MTAKLIFSMLYAALALGANPVFADSIDLSAANELRAGDMKKLVFHAEPRELADLPFFTEDGTKTTLDAYEGKIVVLNMWATWCPPCRAEMPSLDALQADLGGDNFAVVTVATGRNPIASVKKFFMDANIKHLPILLDADYSFGRGIGVMGLPSTIVLDTEGREIARMIGDADWHSEDAVTLMKALLPEDGEG